MKKILAVVPIAALTVAVSCSDAAKNLTGPTTQPSIPKPMFDDVSNNLDLTIDAVAEVMPLNANGADGTTQLYIQPTGGDGKSGCNLQGTTERLDVSVASSNTSVATVSPSTLTFGSCGDTRTLTVTPHSSGSATITLTETANNTGATFDLTNATFTVTVSAPANTAPSISIAGVTGTSYNKGSVPSATCNVTDAEDGPSSFPATLSAIAGPYASDGIGQQTASCSYTDAGGLTASASVTYTIVDPTPPGISYTLAPTSPDGNNGWYKSNVTLSWTVSELESPNSLQETGCVDQNIVADQALIAYSCSATSAGGSAGPVSVSIKRDATAPSVSLVGGPANVGSYYFGSVPAAPTCTANDGLSGLAGSCSVSGYGTTVGSHTVTASATDLAGNSASASATYTVLAWTLTGFYQPVDMNGVYNVVKGGSTVPLKFEVFAGATELTATSVVTSFVPTKVACEGGAPTDDIEFTTTGGTSLRYDATAGQFVQNWLTPKQAGLCYRVTMTTQDGSSLVAFFRLK
jgi:hypothetical protein